MLIREISSKDTWDKFQLAHNPKSFLQSWEWGQVQQATGEEIRYLGFYKNDDLIATALLILVKARRGHHYLVPHGPTIHSEKTPGVGGGQIYKEVITALSNYARNYAQSDKAVGLRIAPLTLAVSPESSIFSDLKFRPAPMHVHAELTWVLDISPSPEDILKAMRKTTRHAIRKAEQSGVTTEIISDPEAILDKFWPLYQTTKARHGFTLWPREMIKQQIIEFQKDNNIFATFAKHENKTVAGAIIPTYGDTAFYYHGASLKAKVPAPQYLQWQAILEAQRRGLKNYNFWGIASDDQPNHPFAGITVFKKGFGGEAKDYMHAQDLPLSIGYWKLWLIETFRRYRRGF